ncbi:hypothetical protein G9A89_023607 [Geosiphon pyriformis]|nr:hypothetical protein G9A89_023607 [Geosiphon pyriformis]
MTAMKKSVKDFSVNIVSKNVASRKKRKGGVLKDSIVRDMVLPGNSVGSSWGSEAGDTTEFDSVDMKKEFLIEETSVNYGERVVLKGKDSNQMPKSPRLVTKQALGKSLSKINFLGSDNDDDIFLDKPVVLSPPLKNLVNVSVRKSFALDIDLVNISGKSTQDKLAVATFTFESSLMKATKLANDVKILVNTDLKKFSGQSDQTVVLKEIPIGILAETVHAALSNYGIIKSIKMQLIGLWQKAVVEFKQIEHADLVAAQWSILIRKDAVRVARSDKDKKLWDAKDVHKALLYTLLMGTNAHDIWVYINSVGGLTCVIDHYLVTYVCAKCVAICFKSAELLDAALKTTSVLRDANLKWVQLVSTVCAKCKKSGHTSLGCVSGGKVFSGSSPRRVFSDADKSRLTTIYVKCLAPVAHSVSFGGVSWVKIMNTSSSSPLQLHNGLVPSGSSLEMKPFLPGVMEVNVRFAALEHSLASLVEQVGQLAKRLDVLGPTNQGADIVMSESSSAATSGGTVTGVVFFDLSSVSKLEDSMKCLMETVLSLSAKFGVSTSHSMSSLVWKVATCNVRGMNNPAKQKDIIRWHKEMNNLVSIIADKFDGVRVFTSGLDSGHLGAGVAVIMNVSLACHVYKVSEVLGQLLSIKLLFKNKLSVSILGLYAGASLAVRFSQTGEVNFFIAKAVNESSFIVFGGNFNEDGSRKYTSFRKCLDLDLANSLVGSPAMKMHTWANFKGVRKMIDYVLVSLNLVNAIIHCSVLDVGGHFETDHQAVSVSLGLGSLLDVQLNSLRKQANRDCWNFNFKGANNVKWEKFKDAMTANAIMFFDDFIASQHVSDLDAM